MASDFPWTGPSRARKCAASGANIVAALAQRRHGNREHVQPEEKILAEAAGGDRAGQIGIRERHQARVHAQRFGAAEALEGALLEHAQQLRLHSGSERRDFVEHDGAALRHLEASRLARHGAGERAALVAKKLGFDKLRRQAGAIDFQERRVAARAALVNPARELIFAGAAFAGDQQRGGGFGELFGNFEDAQTRQDRPPPTRCSPRSCPGRAAFGFVFARFRSTARTRETRRARRCARAARDRSNCRARSLKMCTMKLP